MLDELKDAQKLAAADVSKASATRHLADLLAKGCLTRLPGGGRSTRYEIRWPTEADAAGRDAGRVAEVDIAKIKQRGRAALRSRS